jgi:transposase
MRLDEAAELEPPRQLMTNADRHVDRTSPVTAVAGSGQSEGPKRNRRAGRRPSQKVADLSPTVFAVDTPARSEAQIELGAQERSAMRSVGLDLGTREVSFCEVVDGYVVARRKAGSIEALEDLLGADTRPARVAIEACREAWHWHDELVARGHKVLLVDTTRGRRLGVGGHGRKNDRIDAEVLARAVEQGNIPLAHVLSPARRKLRERLLVRRALVETRTQYITTARGMARSLGEHVPGCDPDNFVDAVARANLRVETRAALTPLVTVLAVLQRQLSTVDVELDALCENEPIVAKLMTIPGIGLVCAAMFIAVVDDPKRFRHAHQLESYLGLVPSEHSTGGKRRLGAITKHGNSYLRALLVQCASSLLRMRADDPMKTWAQAIVKRRTRRVAVVALARRLAGVLWALWRRDVAYDPLHRIRIFSGPVHDDSEALKRALRKIARRRRDAERKLQPQRREEVADR